VLRIATKAKTLNPAQVRHVFAGDALNLRIVGKLEDILGRQLFVGQSEICRAIPAAFVKSCIAHLPGPVVGMWPEVSS